MTDNGGTAFPVTETNNSGQIAPTHIGMTLRDHFAGLAMMGYANLPDFYDMSEESIAEMAYAQADAMIKERGK